MKPGDAIGQYEIESALGRGGMGTVYAVRHRVLGGRHALKVLHPEVAESSGGRERFRREARVMHDLGKAHPHILEVDDYGEEPGGALWLRMPLIKGMPGKEGQRHVTLEDRMKAEGRLSEKEARRLLEQILDGLGYAHEQGALHRDLKPANILLAEDGSVLIVDFGLVKIVDGAWLKSQFEKSIAKTAGFGKTRHAGEGEPGASTAALVGTWAYLAPEIKKGGEATVSSDLWAVGLIAFQLLTGEESPGFKLPSEVVSGLDTEWDGWIERAEARDVTGRFGSAGEMRGRLPKPRSERARETGEAAVQPPVPRRITNQTRVPPEPAAPPKAPKPSAPPAVSRPTPREEETESEKTRFSEQRRVMTPRHENRLSIGQICTRIAVFTGIVLFFAGIYKCSDIGGGAGKNTSGPPVAEKDFAKRYSGRLGSVKIMSIPPGANVNDLAKSSLGSTPLVLKDLTPGPVSYRLELEGYKPVVITGKVRPGEVTQFTNVLEPEEGVELEIAPRAEAETPSSPADEPASPTKPLSNATEPENPTDETSFVNSLGMRFVPVPGTNVLFCEHETRVQDYAAFGEANPGINMDWKDYQYEGQQQGPDHPVVFVSSDDASAFCEWLSKKESKAYRLPTDHEWSCAVGIDDLENENASAEDKDSALVENFPWGSEFPPPDQAGNYADQAARGLRNIGEVVIDGYEDGFAFTAPVASYLPNKFGLYDIGGNVWEYCQGSCFSRPIVRGASWFDMNASFLNSSSRGGEHPPFGPHVGFRIVLERGD